MRGGAGRTRGAPAFTGLAGVFAALITAFLETAVRAIAFFAGAFLGAVGFVAAAFLVSAAGFLAVVFLAADFLTVAGPGLTASASRWPDRAGVAFFRDGVLAARMGLPATRSLRFGARAGSAGGRTTLTRPFMTRLEARVRASGLSAAVATVFPLRFAANFPSAFTGRRRV